MRRRWVSQRGRIEVLVLVTALLFSSALLCAESRVPLPPPTTPAERDSAYRADSFTFIGNNINDLVICILNFNRGSDREAGRGEFFGSLYLNGRWRFLEGNDTYPLRGSDLLSIESFYFVKVNGSREQGYLFKYDAGDYTFTLKTDPIPISYRPGDSENLKNDYGHASAALRLANREIPGSVILERLHWSGFNRMRQNYRGLFKSFHGFMLMSERGEKIYLRQNFADPEEFKNRHRLADTIENKGGFLWGRAEGGPLVLKSVEEIEAYRPFLTFYRVPRRWKVSADGLGHLTLWSRNTILKNWFFGGYALMAIEGLWQPEPDRTSDPASDSRGGKPSPQRVWGILEFIP